MGSAKLREDIIASISKLFCLFLFIATKERERENGGIAIFVQTFIIHLHVHVHNNILFMVESSKH